MKLQFKKWLESIFGQGILDDPEPASEAPRNLNNGAMPSYDLRPLPGNKKAMKKKQSKN
jgi:hypothetical protein